MIVQYIPICPLISVSPLTVSLSSQKRLTRNIFNCINQSRAFRDWVIGMVIGAAAGTLF